MRFINKEFIQHDLLPALDIAKVVEGFAGVTLKKQGSSYECCCPLHHEKTPSFKVNTSHNFFHCFGCSAHGGPVDFVMKLENISYPEAIEKLAQFVGKDVVYDHNSKESEERYNRTQRYYELMERVASYFESKLPGSPGLEYFQKARGLSSETIRKARLGFAPYNCSRDVINLAKDDFEMQLLMDLQVIRKGDNGSYSFFRNRVIIPIFDVKGRVIGFGGRILDSETNGPKYLNSTDSPIFHKGTVLFGLYEALMANKNRLEEVVVVEGYMDAIALRQAGFTNVVASLGTALTKQHLDLLFSKTDKVTFCFDGDNAGRKALWKALCVATPMLPDTKTLRFAKLPPGDDPDTLVRQYGPSKFTEVLNQACDYEREVINYLFNEGDPYSSSGFYQIIFNIASVGIALNSNIHMFALQRETAAAFKISPDEVKSIFNSKGLQVHNDIRFELGVNNREQQSSSSSNNGSNYFKQDISPKSLGANQTGNAYITNKGDNQTRAKAPPYRQASNDYMSSHYDDSAKFMSLGGANTGVGNSFGQEKRLSYSKALPANGYSAQAKSHNNFDHGFDDRSEHTSASKQYAWDRYTYTSYKAPHIKLRFVDNVTSIDGEKSSPWNKRYLADLSEPRDPKLPNWVLCSEYNNNLCKAEIEDISELDELRNPERYYEENVAVLEQNCLIGNNTNISFPTICHAPLRIEEFEPIIFALIAFILQKPEAVRNVHSRHHLNDSICQIIDVLYKLKEANVSLLDCVLGIVIKNNGVKQANIIESLRGTSFYAICKFLSALQCADVTIGDVNVSLQTLSSKYLLLFKDTMRAALDRLSDDVKFVIERAESSDAADNKAFTECVNTHFGTLTNVEQTISKAKSLAQS